MSEPGTPVGPGPRDTERRRITVMFADVTGFTRLTEERGPERTYEVMSGCLMLLDGIARRHGGSVDKYLGDAIMAVFGLPLALEEAPRAAINAAIEMHRAIERYSRERELSPPLRVHIGINTGLAISGDVSGPVLREFAVMGDAVNVASRLKDLAPPGHVWVGLDTWRQTRADFAYRELTSLRVKGKKLPVKAFELISDREQLHRTRGRAAASIFSELVGRDDEMAALVEGVARARRGEGGCVSLVGEAGLGKSRLVDEFLRTPAASTAGRFLGRCVASGRTLAYHPFADLLRGWADADPDADDASQRDTIAKRLGELGLASDDVAAPLLATLMGLPLAADERRRLRGIQGETGAMEHTIQRVVRELLEREAGRGPLILVFEDLHWADTSSIRLLEALLPLARERGILFVLAARPGAAETSEPVLAAADDQLGERHARLTLAPLGEGETRALLRNLCAGGRIPPERLAEIEAKAAGNPFFIEEVMRSLLGQGALVRDQRGLHATPTLDRVTIPGTVHDVVLGRIDLLRRPAKHVLQRASILGRQAHGVVLEAMHQGDEPLVGLLEELEGHQLLKAMDRQGRSYAFVHPLIQEVAYDSVLEMHREGLHLAAAEAIEAHLPDSMPGYHGMLAYHFGLGRDLDRAQEYVNLAGEEATRLAAADEAIFFFEEAARLLFARLGEAADPGLRAALEHNLARARANRGDMAEAVGHLNGALRLLGERVPEGRLGLAWETARGVAALLRALYLPGPRGRPEASEHQREVVDLMFNRARAQTIDDPRFLFDSFQTFRKLWEVDPASVEGSSLVVSGMVGPISFTGLSFSLGRRMLELARPLVRDDARERFFFEFMRFLHGFLSGDWEDDLEIDPALTLETLQHGVLWDVTNYLGLLVEKKTYQGRFDEAQRWLVEIEKIADAYRYDLARSTHRAQTTFWLLERGAIPEARSAADAYYTNHPEQTLSLLALGARAKVRILQGDLDGAGHDLFVAESIRASVRLVAPYQGTGLLRSRLLHDVVELERAVSAGRSRFATATAAHRSARRALRGVRGDAARRPEVYRLEGTRHWLLGRRRSARRWWERSLAAAEALGARPEGARTRLEMGRRLVAIDSEAGREHLAAADAVFAQLGLTWDREQVARVGVDLGGAPTL